jgi:hypothetical protein
MNVHGYSPPITVPEGYPYDVYFTYRTGSWGQGTWRAAWDRLETDSQAFVDLFETAEGRERLRRAGRDLEGMFEAQLGGSIDSIGIWWTMTVVKKRGLSVNPVQSRVRNIGNDGSGTHTVSTSRFDVSIPDNPQTHKFSFPELPFVDENINSHYNRYIGGGTLADRFKTALTDVVESDDPMRTLLRRLPPRYDIDP